jgi:hypothetical protein
MKLLLSLAASLTLITNLFAQGTVNFANGAAGVNAPCFCGGPGYLASAANGPWLAMLYAGPAGTPLQDLTSSIVSGGPAVLGSTPGYVFGGLRTIAGIPAGNPATLQIRVWRSDLGATWEAAGGYGSLYGGTSSAITITLGGGAAPTPNMVGLSSFYICIPEPSAVAIGLLGLGATILRGRRKKTGNSP